MRSVSWCSTKRVLAVHVRCPLQQLQLAAPRSGGGGCPVKSYGGEEGEKTMLREKVDKIVV